MNKTELIEIIAKEHKLSKVASGEILATITSSIVKAVSKGQAVQLIGFGSFGSGKRNARAGRNPRTGDKIKIAAAKTVRFRAGKGFKDAVNKRKA